MFFCGSPQCSSTILGLRVTQHVKQQQWKYCVTLDDPHVHDMNTQGCLKIYFGFKPPIRARLQRHGWVLFPASGLRRLLGSTGAGGTVNSHTFQWILQENVRRRGEVNRDRM